jgi:cytochrome c oxidase subunit 3
MSPDNSVIRPATILLTLLLMGISTLFAGLCGAYLYTVISSGIQAPFPPVLFLVNIIVLIGATYFLRKSSHAYQSRDDRTMRNGLRVSLSMTIAFIILQVFGWLDFFRDIPMTATQTRSFLFVLSALHLLHVLAGIPLLTWFFWKVRMRIDDILFPHQHYAGFIRGLVRYWNFLDILWILLIVVLTVGFCLKWL